MEGNSTIKPLGSLTKSWLMFRNEDIYHQKCRDIFHLTYFVFFRTWIKSSLSNFMFEAGSIYTEGKAVNFSVISPLCFFFIYQVYLF